MRDAGIDVSVVHPSPVATNFYSNTGGLASLESAKKLAGGPELVADTFFAAAGRIVVYDQGTMCLVFRLVTKLVDFAFFHEVASRLAYVFNADHAMLVARSTLRAPKDKSA